MNIKYDCMLTIMQFIMPFVLQLLKNIFKKKIDEDNDLNTPQQCVHKNK